MLVAFQVCWRRCTTFFALPLPHACTALHLELIPSRTFDSTAIIQLLELLPNLSATGDVRESEVEDLFYKYGRISSIDIKPGTNGGMPAYCFVEFSHSDDAYDAVRALDGRDALGKRLRVSRMQPAPTLLLCQEEIRNRHLFVFKDLA